MPRSENTAQVIVYIAKEDREKIERAASRHNLNISAYIRALIDEDIAEHGEQLTPLEHGGNRKSRSHSD